MNFFGVLSLTFVVFVSVYGDLLTDIDKYNENFDKLVTTDYERLIQLKDRALDVFSETGGAATKAVKSLIDFQWDRLDDLHRKATTNLMHGLTERARRINLNSQRLFDLLNIEYLEDEFDRKVESPLSTGDLWLSLINTTSRDHAKSNFYNYCTSFALGPIETLDNIAEHSYQYCQVPNEINIDYYFIASYVFQSFEKQFDLDSEYFDLKRGLLRFTLFEGDIAVVEEKIQALESMNVYFGSELMPKLREIQQEDDESNTRCWLEMVFTHCHQRIPDYENFGVILLSTLFKADDLLMSCQAMNDSIGFMKHAKNITKLVGDYIDVFKHKMIKKAWPSAIEKRIKEVLPVTTLPKNKFNSTTTAIKHAANLMVDKSTKFHVIITDMMESDNFYTSCVHKSDCLIVQSADVNAFVFLSKLHGQDRNATLSAETYYSTCRKEIKKILKANAGENPATIWPKIEEVCPRILHFYRHIFFGTGFKAEGFMKIGWSYAGWNTYQHIHKYYERGQSVTGQEYHLFMMMQ